METETRVIVLTFKWDHIDAFARNALMASVVVYKDCLPEFSETPQSGAGGNCATIPGSWAGLGRLPGVEYSRSGAGWLLPLGPTTQSNFCLVHWTLKSGALNCFLRSATALRPPCEEAKPQGEVTCGHVRRWAALSHSPGTQTCQWTRPGPTPGPVSTPALLLLLPNGTQTVWSRTPSPLCLV